MSTLGLLRVPPPTAALPKASLPVVVLAALVLAGFAATQLFMLLPSATVSAGNGPGAVTLWARSVWLKMSLAVLYALPTIALWHAPLYGWLLLVFGWARRATLLWAVLPPSAISFLDTMTLRALHLASLFPYRVLAWFTQALFARAWAGLPPGPSMQLIPGPLLASLGLWIGVGAAAIVLAAAVSLRRHRDPIRPGAPDPLLGKQSRT